jgi:hypothetical protein
MQRQAGNSIGDMGVVKVAESLAVNSRLDTL